MTAKRCKHDFLRVDDLSAEALGCILDDAAALATAWDSRTMPSALQDCRVGLIVDDSGWRNTFAFDLGVQAMGGICAHPPISLGPREAMADLAGYLENWVDILVVRTKELERLAALSAQADIPVVNARTGQNHPCETLGDLAYINAVNGTIEGLKVAVVGPDANILSSWIEAAAVLPLQVTHVYPARLQADPAQWQVERFDTCDDIDAVVDADVVVTDVWLPDNEPNELKRFQITASLLDKMSPQSLFIPCPPVHRGEEVSADAMEHGRCHARAAKAYLLHAQNALLKWLWQATNG